MIAILEFISLFYFNIYVKFFPIKRFDLFIFRQRGREREGEEKKHQCVSDTSTGCLSHASNQGSAHSPGLCPDWELNW